MAREAEDSEEVVMPPLIVAVGARALAWTALAVVVAAVRVTPVAVAVAATVAEVRLVERAGLRVGFGILARAAGAGWAGLLAVIVATPVVGLVATGALTVDRQVAGGALVAGMALALQVRVAAAARVPARLATEEEEVMARVTSEAEVRGAEHQAAVARARASMATEEAEGAPPEETAAAVLDRGTGWLAAQGVGNWAMAEAPEAWAERRVETGDREQRVVAAKVATWVARQAMAGEPAVAAVVPTAASAAVLAVVAAAVAATATERNSRLGRLRCQEAARTRMGSPRRSRSRSSTQSNTADPSGRSPLTHPNRSARQRTPWGLGRMSRQEASSHCSCTPTGTGREGGRHRRPQNHTQTAARRLSTSSRPRCRGRSRQSTSRMASARRQSSCTYPVISGSWCTCSQAARCTHCRSLPRVRSRKR